MEQTTRHTSYALSLLRAAIILVLLIVNYTSGYAFNVRQTLSNDGLSNSAILSLCRDDNGFLWVGTCDGVNIADGSAIYDFTDLFPGQVVSGNIIETIVKGSDSNMWILTNYGLDLVDIRKRTLHTYTQFHGQEKLCAWPGGVLVVLSEDSDLYVYEPGKSEDFRLIGHLNHTFLDVSSLMERDGQLWLTASDGVYVYPGIDTATGDAQGNIAPVKVYSHIKSHFSKPQDDKLFIISTGGDICEVETDGKVTVVTNISDTLANRGEVSDLVRDHQDNFFISFRTNGVVWVGLDEQRRFVAVDLKLQVGVFCLEQSTDQDVVWIGSDCQGVYTYWDDRFSIRSYDFNYFGNKISHPVRAIYLDEYRNLWLGTKGDGLLKIPDVNEYYAHPSLPNGRLFTSADSELCHNSVFAFAGSARPILWVGTDEGLNYYDYSDGRLHRVSSEIDVRHIHGIYEFNDTTLWLCTLGDGIVKARITGQANRPQLTDMKLYTIDNGKVSSNHFFAMTDLGNGNMLFCNRGKGVFEIKNDSLSSIPLKRDFGTNTVTDVFDAVKDGDILWLGTGFGVIKSWPGGEEHLYGAENGFINSTIHEMLKDGEGMIWLSTNNGLVRLNPANGNSQTYGQNYGMKVTEYSDGAGFFTGKSLIFGGVNGITFVNRHDTYDEPAPYAPKLKVLKLSVFGQDVPLDTHLLGEGKKNKIVLDPDQNNFSITISAPDYINARNYTYSYSLDGENWINNGTATTITFNELRYGSYNLSVRYVNRATGVESEPYTIEIVVKAPWYLTNIAKAVYALLILAFMGGVVHLYMRRQRRQQKEKLDRLKQAHREEVYEEKLKFFTNITHEFCTPLTLIYGPCERIQEYPGSDDYIRKYLGLIRTNAERLNNLIQELIDFRRIETGHKILKPCRVDVSLLCDEIANSFTELAERNTISFVNEIKPDIQWPSDYGCLRKIVTNLVSNAFKYTSTGGTIRISVGVEDDKLRISVYNTGKGISAENKSKIFNRYSILDNVEENAVKGLSNRNGLGMAICHSMVDMLGGTIEIDSRVGEYADFIVRLPGIEIPQETTQAESVTADGTAGDIRPVAAGGDREDALPSALAGPSSKTGEKILVVDDNEAILALLEDSLSDYEVMRAESAEKALEMIRTTVPDLILSDIMMPGTDGVTFTRMIKGNKHTMHIPLILLSAKTSNEEKVEGIESGADAYISKPFSVSYLRAVVKRLLENRMRLREYYNTAASAYEYNDGRLLHRDDKDFLKSIVDFIHEHIDDTELSPEQLAEHMKISVRNLYRKFKELDQLSPNDFIKYQRISHAAKLLITTSVTVQEVIYRCGFTNRSHFYKEFDKRFGMTPKDYRTANAHKDTSLEGGEACPLTRDRHIDIVPDCDISVCNGRYAAVSYTLVPHAYRHRASQAVTLLP